MNGFQNTHSLNKHKWVSKYPLLVYISLLYFSKPIPLKKRDPSDGQLTNGSQSQTQTNASLEGSLGPPMTKPWATNASLKARWTLIRDFRSDSIRLYRRSKRKKKKIYEMIVFVFVVNPTLLGLCFD